MKTGDFRSRSSALCVGVGPTCENRDVVDINGQNGRKIVSLRHAIVAGNYRLTVILRTRRGTEILKSGSTPFSVQTGGAQIAKPKQASLYSKQSSHVKEHISADVDGGEPAAQRFRRKLPGTQTTGVTVI